MSALGGKLRANSRTLGSADGFEGSVAFGNVLNVYNNDILITNNISGGNSGGPLIDNEGYVVGVVTWGMDIEQYNGARSLDAFWTNLFGEIKEQKTGAFTRMI